MISAALRLLLVLASPTVCVSLSDNSPPSRAADDLEEAEQQGPGISGSRVAVSREDFKQKVRGRTFKRWSDFKAALGPDAVLEPDVGGEVRLMSGLAIAVVIIINVIVFSIVFVIMAILSGTHPRSAGWVIFGFLCFYSLIVYLYCLGAYAHPEQRVMTNFLFGMVPLAVSSASYVLAGLVLDATLVLCGVGDGWEVPLRKRLNPWENGFLGRLTFLLAVVPGLTVSVYLGNTVSTGFKNGATHVDVLSLCLFVDVGRFVCHFSYLVARDWSIGSSQSAAVAGGSRNHRTPGLCYVLLGTCLAWYVALARLEAGHQSVILQDATKVRTLASLTSYVFFPLCLYVIIKWHLMWGRESVEAAHAVAPPEEEAGRTWWHLMWGRESVEAAHAVAPPEEEAGRTCPAVCCEPSLVLSVLMVGLFMLLVGVVFDALEPNLLGIAILLWAVFYSAGRVSGCNVLVFILALLPLAAMAFGCALLAAKYGVLLRVLLLRMLAPGAPRHL